MRDIPLPSLGRWPRLDVTARRFSYAFGQLLERRLWLFVVADVFFIASGIIGASVAGAGVPAIYSQGVLLPSLVLGIPTLAGVVALERRSGSLDLALSVASTERYFLRRVGPVLAVVIVQGFLFLGLAHLEEAGGFLAAVSRWDLLVDLLRTLVFTVLIAAFLGSVTLFWAVRLQSSGAVAVSSALTTLFFLPWLASPLPGSGDGRLSSVERVLGVSVTEIAWFLDVFVLALGCLIFYLYARERLRRPETMLT